MQLQMHSFVTFVLAIVLLVPAALAQPPPVFEDILTNTSRIAGQWGSGIFSADGYTLTQSGGTDPLGMPRSEDFVWYNLPGPGSDGSGSIEFDIKGLYSLGMGETDIMASCDSTGLRPAETSEDFYNSPYGVLCLKRGYGEGYKTDMVTIASGCEGVEGRGDSDVLPWDGTTTYRFRATWSGTQMRWYRGLPGQTLTLLQPPTPFEYNPCSWSPNILHIQIGATWRAGPRGIPYAGANPGTLYSLLRVYEEDIGAVATPLRGWTTTVTIDLGTTDITLGMNRVVVSDGDTIPITIGGRDARKNLDPNSDYYFYFNVHDYFAYQGNKPDVYIMIDYYDSGTGSLTLQYDATGTIYKNGGSVTLTGTNTWQQYYYQVTDAYFGNRQNGGADFRLSGGVENTFYLDVVSVSTVTPLPAQAGEPNPANLATGISRTADLSWVEAERATSYDVYFGLSSPPGFQGNQSQTTFDPPGTMDPLTVYYWRIDTVNGFGTTTGDVWCFTTVSYPGDFDEDLDIDQEDFGYLQACYTGTGIGYGPECSQADLDSDNDVDLEDLAVFKSFMGGADKPPGS